MKLYTEEQVIDILQSGSFPFDDDEVDEIISKITPLGMGDIRITQGYLDDIEKQAKAIEKNKMLEFWKGGQDSMEEGGKSFEQYYKETYGK